MWWVSGSIKFILCALNHIILTSLLILSHLFSQLLVLGYCYYHHFRGGKSLQLTELKIMLKYTQLVHRDFIWPKT
jgi:hypothetical protein